MNQKFIPSGFFLTLEGPDGSGKTTQASLLATKLKEEGYSVILTREPGGTKLAEKIRNLLLDPDTKLCQKTELLLYLAARAQHVNDVIKPALAEGKIVICDRFNHSTMVYQGLTQDNVNIDEIDAINEFASDKIEPDYTIVLDADPAELLARRKNRGVQDKYEKYGLLFQEKVRNGFLTLANEWYPEHMSIVNALQPEETVLQNILDILHLKLEAIDKWNDLEAIFCDDNDCIEKDWQHFPKGTPKIDVWRWFEETYHVSVRDDLIWRS